MALSGGERRRVEIARCLAAGPKYVLLDEPFAGVDPIAVGEIRHLVADLKKRGIGVLITDHNVQETLQIVDRAYILHDGKVLMSGTTEEVVKDENVRRVYLGNNFRVNSILLTPLTTASLTTDHVFCRQIEGDDRPVFLPCMFCRLPSPSNADKLTKSGRYRFPLHVTALIAFAARQALLLARHDPITQEKRCGIKSAENKSTLAKPCKPMSRPNLDEILEQICRTPDRGLCCFFQVGP